MKLNKNNKQIGNNKRIKTSTKNVIISCVLTALLSIPLTILGTNKYADLNQSQGQNQNIIVNIKEQDRIDLNNKISELESQNSELQNNIMNIQANNINSILDMNITNGRLFINNIEQPISNSAFFINVDNNTYIRTDIIDLIFYNVSEESDGEFNIDIQNNNIFVEYGIKSSYSLLDNSIISKKPYTFSTEPFTIQKNIYVNGFSVSCNEYQDILFELNGKYTAFEFDFGHIDNSGEYMCVAKFYVDDQLVLTLAKNSYDDISHEIIPLNGGEKLKISVITKNKSDDSSLCAKYGFANTILTQYH